MPDPLRAVEEAQNAGRRSVDRRELAAMLGVTTRTLAKLGITKVKIGGAVWYDLRDVAAYLGGQPRITGRPAKESIAVLERFGIKC